MDHLFVSTHCFNSFKYQYSSEETWHCNITCLVLVLFDVYLEYIQTYVLNSIDPDIKRVFEKVYKRLGYILDELDISLYKMTTGIIMIMLSPNYLTFYKDVF